MALHFGSRLGSPVPPPYRRSSSFGEEAWPTAGMEFSHVFLVSKEEAVPKIIGWLHDHFELKEGKSMAKGDLYRLYQQMCGQQQMELTTPAAFGKIVRMAFPSLRCTRKQLVHHYKDFQVKPTSSLNVVSSPSPGQFLSSASSSLFDPSNSSSAPSSPLVCSSAGHSPSSTRKHQPQQQQQQPPQQVMPLSRQQIESMYMSSFNAYSGSGGGAMQEDYPPPSSDRAHQQHSAPTNPSSPPNSPLEFTMTEPFEARYTNSPPASELSSPGGQQHVHTPPFGSPSSPFHSPSSLSFLSHSSYYEPHHHHHNGDTSPAQPSFGSNFQFHAMPSSSYAFVRFHPYPTASSGEQHQQHTCNDLHCIYEHSNHNNNTNNHLYNQQHQNQQQQQQQHHSVMSDHFARRRAISAPAHPIRAHSHPDLPIVRTPRRSSQPPPVQPGGTFQGPPSPSSSLITIHSNNLSSAATRSSAGDGGVPLTNGSYLYHHMASPPHEVSSSSSRSFIIGQHKLDDPPTFDSLSLHSRDGSNNNGVTYQSFEEHLQ
ncbi:Transcription factor rfx3 [Balamuthia mandrillaris]